MIDSFSEAEKLLLVLDMIPKFSDLIVVTILSSYLGGQYNSTYAAAYFSRGTIKLNEFQFDEAIADFDKALKFEPLMEFALANRAFARIRKYQFANSRTISKNSQVTVLASKDQVPIPADEKDKICNDLQKAVFLGDKSKMITEAISNYCQVKSSR